MSKEIHTRGIVLLTIMFLIMFTAKVFGVLDWCPWWWVVAPIWLPFALILLFALVVLVLRGIKNFLND